MLIIIVIRWKGDRKITCTVVSFPFKLLPKPRLLFLLVLWYCTSVHFFVVFRLVIIVKHIRILVRIKEPLQLVLYSLYSPAFHLHLVEAFSVACIMFEGERTVLQ